MRGPVYWSAVLFVVYASDEKREVFSPCKVGAFSTREAALKDARERREGTTGLLYYIREEDITFELVDQDYPTDHRSACPRGGGGGGGMSDFGAYCRQCGQQLRCANCKAEGRNCACKECYNEQVRQRKAANVTTDQPAREAG